MASEAITLAVFATLAFLVPLSMLAFSKLIGARPNQNPIKLGNYESAEVPFGPHKDVTNEYLHYFPLYLGFELVAVIILSWVIVFNNYYTGIDVIIIGISVFAFILSMFAILIARSKDKVERGIDFYGG